MMSHYSPIRTDFSSRTTGRKPATIPIVPKSPSNAGMGLCDPNYSVVAWALIELELFRTEIGLLSDVPVDQTSSRIVGVFRNWLNDFSKE